MPNRVAFITGASRGIGRAIALTLSRAGHDVVIASFEVEKNQEVAAEVQALGGKALPVDLNLTSQDSIKQGIAQASKEFGKIDILVNNAGITRDTLSMRMKPQDWDMVLQINLSGSFFAAQQVIPQMMRERWGRIINIASVVGQRGNAGQANYVASKACIIGLTKALALELGGRNITVNAVAPGYIETDMTANLSQEVKDRFLAEIPLKRAGAPDDVAAAVKFLASDDAAYITGHVINVNGGMYM
jgi:3-oxoacyl-[acyl-carrier protein] reductase